MLMRELTVQRGEGGSLLYQALFSFQDARHRVSNWGGLAHEQILLFQRGATEDLGLWFLDNDRGMVGGITYNSDIIEADYRATAARPLPQTGGRGAGRRRNAGRPSQLRTRFGCEAAACPRRRQQSRTPRPAPLHGLFEASADKAGRRNRRPSSAAGASRIRTSRARRTASRRRWWRAASRRARWSRCVKSRARASSPGC